MIEDISEVIKDGTASQIAESLSQHAVQIEQAWARAEKARDIIHRLNQFPEIADLSEPNIDSKSMRWHNLIALARLYQSHANLHTEPNDIQAVLADLIELDSVVRKLSLNMRPLIPKLVCLVCVEADIATANAIVNHPQTPRELIELLANQFTPLTVEQLSLRNGILYEYFLLKQVLSIASDEVGVAKVPLLKSNSLLRLYRNFYDDWIDAVEGRGDGRKERLSVWPAIYPFAQPSMSFSNREIAAFAVPML